MVRLPKGSKKVDEGNGVALYELPPHPKTRYPLWSIKHLRKNIEQAQAQIDKFELHIAEQRELIKERQEQIALCEERDRAIAQWEADRANSDIPPGD